ncbi:hypothetical protein QWI17_20815 [Gilvimarinus sp. SDUM040013]|uniref:Integrin n=1 Tax=Gilvimarinus gilvus TaxID=3058038 RepID=A0ABU4RUB7_9GAMM|nr:hypothetical protein [Gilvimarinus sp. SDUM040013]MDO3388301.1 hypothetical protein [Gilvimarinus sp. SDUM040013]MDX6847851.1 hypothetical protein [Gilvimarinus sp. SDUM040013]
MRDEFFTPRKHLRAVAGALLCLTLTACGSDSDSDSSDSSSSATSSSSSSSSESSSASSVAGSWPDINIEAAAAKSLRIYWDAVDGATFYRVYKDPDGNSGFSQIGGDVTAPEIYDTVSVHLKNWAEARYMVEACVSDNDCENSEQAIAIHAMADSIGYAKASNTDAEDWFGWDIALSGDGKTLAVGAIQEDSTSRGIDGDQDNNDNLSTGAVYVFSLSSTGWSQQAYIKASNTEQLRSIEDSEGNELEFYISQDRFGYSVDLSDDGSTLAVGAIREDSNARGINGDEDNNQASEAGAVYMFERNAGTWAQTAYVKASNTPEEESSSSSSDSSSSSSTSSDSSSSDSSSSSEESDTTGDRFGHSVALSGDGTTLAVGAIYEASADGGINGDESDNTAPNAGAVYIFTQIDSGWTQQAYLKTAAPRGGDRFGSSLALSHNGDVLAVGAIGEDGAGTGVNEDIPDDSLVTSSGAAYIFRRSDAAWEQEAYLKTTFTFLDQRLGTAIALSADGHTLAVSATGEGSRATGINGDPEDYAELLELADGEDRPETAYKSGAVYIYQYDENTWSMTTYIKASNADAYDEFGRDLAISADGNYLAVGAFLEDSQASAIDGDQEDNSLEDSGAVYLFERTGTNWHQLRYIKAKRTEANDRLGNAVALDGTSATLAIASYHEDSTAKGLSADDSDNSANNSGAVLLY